MLRLIIGNKNYSSWSLAPWFLMKQAGLKFDEIRVPLFTAEGDRLLGELSPSKKVPVLYDDDLVLWDSLAICSYIADRHPDLHLWPVDHRTRAEARVICAEMHSGFQIMREQMPMNCRRQVKGFSPSDEASQVIRRIHLLFETALQNRSVKGPWLHGKFSISDAMFAPDITRFKTYGVTCAPTVQTYCDHVLSHPVIKAWYADAERETEIIDEAEKTALTAVP